MSSDSSRTARPCIPTLIKMLETAKPGAGRDGIVRQILEAGPEAIEPLVQAVIRDSKRRKYRILQVALRNVALLLMVIILLAELTGHRLFNPDLSGLGVFVFGGSLIATSALERNSVSLLVMFDDVRAVRALMALLGATDLSVRATAIEGLTRLLPQMKASDHELLSQADREKLNGWLFHPIRDYDFTIAILKALSQVGDETSLLYVQALTQTPGINAKDAAVRDAAIECLPGLEACIQKSKEATTLLRPAVVSAAVPDQLLRPAAHSEALSETLLLRPASND